MAHRRIGVPAGWTNGKSNRARSRNPRPNTMDPTWGSRPEQPETMRLYMAVGTDCRLNVGTCRPTLTIIRSKKGRRSREPMAIHEACPEWYVGGRKIHLRKVNPFISPRVRNQDVPPQDIRHLISSYNSGKGANVKKLLTYFRTIIVSQDQFCSRHGELPIPSSSGLILLHVRRS